MKILRAVVRESIKQEFGEEAARATFEDALRDAVALGATSLVIAVTLRRGDPGEMVVAARGNSLLSGPATLAMWRAFVQTMEATRGPAPEGLAVAIRDITERLESVSGVALAQMRVEAGGET